MIAQLKKIYALFTRRDKIIFCTLLLFMVVGALFEVLGIGTIPVFVGFIAYPDKVMQYPAVQSVLHYLGLTSATELLIWGSAALIIFFGVKNGILAINFYLQARFTKSRMVYLSKGLFSAYMNAPYQLHLHRNVAELHRNAIVEPTIITNRILSQLLLCIMKFFMALAILILLFVTEPYISFITFTLFTTISVIFFWIIQKKVNEYGLIEQKQRKFQIQALNQGLGSLKEARVQNREAFFIHKFSESTLRRAAALRFKEVASKVNQPFMEFMAVVGILCITIILVFTRREIESIVTTLALFVAALSRMKDNIGGLVQSFLDLKYDIVAVNPVYDDLKALSGNNKPVFTKKGKIVLLKLNRFLSIENLSYRYPGSLSPALYDIHCRIKKGESVGFVGSTGSGKTTIVDLILGLLVPGKGKIIVDDVNIFSNLRGWRKNIGYIPQFIYLLDDTIKRNIALGLEDKDIQEEKVRKVLKAAQLEDFVNTLPKGLNTMTGERGIRLSGGQRQRIGIARALYHNPDVLIMDEATSALDNKTESSVVKALESLKGDRTVIIIAHRLSTVRNCDRLFFIRNGRIENSGNYRELCRMNSEFRAMAVGA